MKAFLSILLSAALSLTAAFPPALHAGEKPKEKPADKKLDGYWVGTLKVGIELRLVAKFTKKKDGTLGGTLDSPDQGVKGLVIDEATLKDRDLRFEVKSVK